MMAKKQANKKILIRADGSKRIGMGHIYRTITLAKYLRKNYGFEIFFVSRKIAAVQRIIVDNDFSACFLPYNISKKREIGLLREILLDQQPDIIIIDLLNHSLDRSYMSSLRYSGQVGLVAFIDRHTKTIVDADMVFNTSVFQKYNYYENDGRTRYYLGFDYLILPEEYMEVKEKKRDPRKTVKRVMICMGGSDHNNLTFKVLKAIDKSCSFYDCDVVLNSDFVDRPALAQLVSKMKHKINVHYDVKSLVELLGRADMAITAGGYTHVERMCAGVPGVVINQLCHQAKLSNWIMEQKGTLDLGLHKQVRTNDILCSFDHLIGDFEYRKAMAERGRQLVSGQGLRNISQAIAGVGK
ncbi:UDP-2,4-diacetamido-2,4,6-trideoxy-beta-L-altropyranose hydrolase [Candidatus Margulisiibacteriota bacterium]